MQMDKMTQQNAALVEESSAASRSMEEQGKKLVELMGFFRLGDESDQTRATQIAGKPRTQESRLAQLRREKGLPTPAEMRKAAG